MPGAMETSATARLTEREKDCLRRWLRHETAKEIALDLGISPHAVEKRLKMARAKLGVSSSLEAARLLEADEGYHQEGPQTADLGGNRKPSQHRWQRPLVMGVLAMFIAVTTALLLTTQAANDGTTAANRPQASGEEIARLPPGPQISREDLAQLPPYPTPTADTRRVGGRPVIWRAVDPAAPKIDPTKTEVHLVVTTTFRGMDRDDSGFIEPHEIGSHLLERRTFHRDENGKFQLTSTHQMTQAEYLAPGDANGDGKWDFAEFRDWMAPHVIRNGIDPQMRAEIESAY